MTSALLSLLIWLPFLILAVTFGIVFGILGFKRGSIKAAISVVVTVVSTALSILLARLLASSIAGSLTPVLRDLLGGDATLLDMEHFAALVTGCATAIGALLLFIPVFLLMLLIFKNLTSLVFTKKIPQAKHIGNKLGGLALGLADALLVAFLLLLPLYGTLGLGSNLLSVVSAMEQPSPSDGLSLNVTLLGSEGTTFRPVNDAYITPAAEAPSYGELLDVLCNTPLAELASTPLFSTVYDSMASFTHNGETVSVSETVTTVSNVAGAFLSYQKGEEGAADKMVEAFDEMETLVTESNFFAGLLCDVVENTAGQDDSLLAGYEGFSDKETLRGDLPAVFTLARSAIENNILSELMSGEPNLAEMDFGTFPYDMAEALNSTESLAKWKANIINGAIDTVLESVASNSEDPAATVAELKEILGTVSETPLSKEEQKAEGDALHLLLNALTTAGDEDTSMKMMGDVIEGLARHPSFGVDKVTQITDKLMESTGMGGGGAISGAIGDALNDAVSKPVGESGFGDFTQATVDATDALQGITNGDTDPAAMEKLLNTDADTLLKVKDTLSSDLLSELGLDAATAAKAKRLFDTLFETIAESDFSENETKEEATALSYALSTMTAAGGKETDELTDVIPEPSVLLDNYLASDVLTETMNKLTANGESDPLDLFDSLGKNAKKEMANLIKDTHAKRVGADASVTEKLSDLATFLGIEVKLA